MRRLMIVSGLVLLALALVGPAAAQGNTARVRVIHASPDAPAVDVFVDGQAVLTNVAFPAISNYLDVPAGPHEVRVAPAGQGANAAVITANLTLEAGRAYTVAAVGQLANIRAQVYNDNLSAPAAGKAHVRVIHASPDAPAVRVGVANGPTLIESLAFPNASDYLPVDAGTYDLQVTPAGADDVVLDLAGTTLQAGTIYDVVAVGNLANIRAEVATFTPQQAAPAPAPGGATPGTLPDTGVSDAWLPLALLFGVLLLGGGLALRRRLA